LTKLSLQVTKSVDVGGITFKLNQIIQRNKHCFALQMTKGQTNLFAITLVQKKYIYKKTCTKKTT